MAIATCTQTDTSAARKVNLKGEMYSGVSMEWMKRPADERFVSMEDLISFTKGLHDRSEMLPIDRKALEFRSDASRGLYLAADGQEASFTNWSLDQAASAVGFPRTALGKIAQLDPALAAQNLNLFLRHAEGQPEDAGLYIDTKKHQLRSWTGARYGRIPDHAVAQKFVDMAAAGETLWKVPGEMREMGIYNPMVQVTKENTTLFASDRDIMFFLVADLEQDAIEVGKLPNGDPDLMFRGVIVRNSELGRRRLTVETMLMSAVCMNRNLWNVQGFQNIEIIHREGAIDRWDDVQLWLDDLSKADKQPVVNAVKAAKVDQPLLMGNSVQTAAEAQVQFLVDECNFQQGQAEAIVAHRSPGEDERPSLWTLAGRVTSYAQKQELAEDRFTLEAKGTRILEMVQI